MYIVGRPINGISINGLEYLLEENGNEMLFPTQHDAELFLLRAGETLEGLDHYHFVQVEMVPK